jgi:hypothetical protein
MAIKGYIVYTLYNLSLMKGYIFAIFLFFVLSELFSFWIGFFNEQKAYPPLQKRKKVGGGGGGGGLQFLV